MANFFDLLRVAVLFLGFGYVARQDRKTWMWAESMMWGLYAAVLFLWPSTMVPGIGSSSLFFTVRIFASMLLAGQYGMFSSRMTRDESVIGTILWARLLSASMLVFVMGYSYSQKSDNFPDKIVYFDMLGFALAVLTSAYQMWQGQYRVGGREEKGYVGTICRVFFLLSFLSGVSFLAFPSWMLFQKPDAIETVMLRSVGAMVFGGSVVWWYATSFRNDKDKSTIFKWYFVNAALIFVSMCLGYFRDGLFGRQEFLSMHCAFIPILLAALGQYLLWKRSLESSSSSYYLRSKMQ